MFKTEKEIISLTLEDLKKSGIVVTKNKLKSLNIEPVTSAQATNLLKFTASYGYLFRYDTNGTVRLKVLDKHFTNKSGKQIKYLSPKEHVPSVYFPPNTGINWKAHMKKKNAVTYITEGEKKAIAACLLGFPTIALSGVWSFRSNKKNIDLIPELHEGWLIKSQTMCIVFDSDVVTNDKVEAAREELTSRLMDVGFIVNARNLPIERGKGLDDFFVSFKTKSSAIKAFNELELISGEELHTPLTKKISSLNNEYAYIKSEGKYIRLQTGHLIPPAALEEELKPYKHWNEDTGKYESMYRVWTHHGMRREFDTIITAPGQPLHCYDTVSLSYNCLNKWRQFDAIPIKSDVKPFLKHVELMCNGDTELTNFVLKWLGYPVKYPGTKLKSAVLIISTAQQVGKTFIGRIMCDLYGMHNSRMMEHSGLNTGWGDYISGISFICANELIANKRQDADTMKSYITEPFIMLNMKGKAVIYQTNISNFFLTSNNPNPSYVDPSDRRYTVIEYRGKAQPAKYYQQLDEWRTNGGLNALYHYFKHELDYGDFNENTPAMSTSEKLTMIETSMRPQDLWLTDALTNPKHELVMPQEMAGGFNIPASHLKRLSKPRPCYTPQDIAWLYEAHTGNYVDSRTMSQAMSRLNMIRRGHTDILKPKEFGSSITKKSKETVRTTLRLYYITEKDYNEFMRMSMAARGKVYYL